MKAKLYQPKDIETTIVDCARVSFSKKAEGYTPEQNTKLIKYLVKHGHWTPLAHSYVSFYMAWIPEHSLRALLSDKFSRAGVVFDFSDSMLIHGKYHRVLVTGSYHALVKLSQLGQPLQSHYLRAYLRELAPTAYDAYDIEERGVGSPIDTDIEELPLSHTYKTVHCKAPIFVARQLGKHQVDMTWNEISRRYVDDVVEFFEGEWRKRAPNLKQGSLEETIEWEPTIYGAIVDEDGNMEERDLMTPNGCLYEIYNQGINLDIAPEQARMLLPQSMYTEWFWTGSLQTWDNVFKLRLEEHTQKETRDMATLIKEELE